MLEGLEDEIERLEQENAELRLEVGHLRSLTDALHDGALVVVPSSVGHARAMHVIATHYLKEHDSEFSDN